MLLFHSAIATLLGSSSLSSVTDKGTEIRSGNSAEGSFRCAGGDNGFYVCMVDTSGKGFGDVAELKNQACAGWANCADVILGGTIDGVKYAALGKEEDFNPKARLGGGSCTSLKWGLVGCLY